MQKNIIPHWFEPEVIEHSKRILKSYESVTGIQLFDNNHSDEYLSYLLYHAPYVVVSHGIQQDPVFYYANLTAQQLWHIDWERFIQLPSRFSVEPDRIEDREQLLAEAAKNGFINNYSGVRIASTGRRFRIENVLLWNLHDEENKKIGQVALFRKWTNL